MIANCRFAAYAAVFCASFVVSSCAFDVISIKQTPANLEPVSQPVQTWTLAAPAKVRLVQGYATELRQGTKWLQVGRIPQGDVFRTTDQLVAVDASNQHEADLVVNSGKAVGFYLVVEHSFTPADPPMELQTTP